MFTDPYYIPAHQPMSHAQIIRRIRDLQADAAFWRNSPKLESYSRRYDEKRAAACEAEIARLDKMLEGAR